MASNQALGAAAQDRKARLAQLKSLKRKHPDTSQEPSDDDGRPALPSPQPDADAAAQNDVTTTYLSGRNYDAETKGPRLGFETAPAEGEETLEKKAARRADGARREAEEAAQADKPLDLFTLQPQKPNWDLKRDLERQLHVLNVRTDNAIARLVRERIATQRQAAQAQVRAGAATNGHGQRRDEGQGEAEAVGIEGATLVEATYMREREEEADERLAREEEAALLDAR